MLKIIKSIVCISSIFITNNSYADMSYGGKFVTTTLSGCAIGGTSAYLYANSTGFESQPRQIVTFLGSTTGCITGALFSYLFYNDKSLDLTQQLSANQKTISDLKNQLSQFKGAQLSGPIDHPQIGVSSFSTSPLDQNFESNIIDMKRTSLSELPTGIAIKDTQECREWARISLIPDLKNPNKKAKNLHWIALDENFAVIGIQFAYTPKKCFMPSPLQGGVYFGQYWPGVRDFLNRKVWAVQQSLNNEE